MTIREAPDFYKTSLTSGPDRRSKEKDGRVSGVPGLEVATAITHGDLDPRSKGVLTSCFRLGSCIGR